MSNFVKYANSATAALRAGKAFYDEAQPYIRVIGDSLKRERIGPSSYGGGARSYSARPTRRHFKRRPRRRVRRVSRRRVVRRTRRFRKVRKATRVAPAIPRRTVYMRRRKGIRRGNQGILSLQRRLQAGMSLPEQTFTRFYYRGSAGVDFSVVGGENTTGNTFLYPRLRTYVLNDVSGSPYAENTVVNNVGTHGLSGQIMYKDFWAGLYNSYMILGAKMKVLIRPTIYPQRLANTTEESGINAASRYVPPNAQPGYYYARVFYIRANNGTVSSIGSSPVGYPISKTYNFNHDRGQEDFWPHLRDFLSDNTVTWKKDTTSMRTKIHLETDNSLGGLPSVVNPVDIIPSVRTNYELETSNRPITLTVNFSAKKNFMTKNILVNGTWNDWDTELAPDYRFYVRFGYIGFSQDGRQAYHIPIDRGYYRAVEVDITYFAALRDPKISPTMYDGFPDAALKAPEGVSEVDEEELFSDGEESAAL